ncbi:hypothetical protein G9F31_09865 [Acinetobacter sp. 187]|uniref:Uncharacterized protein n=1 Tax=Acinetobacter lanii TaxID=2715163 RepID=A0A6G8S3Z7_9GAMM|nr:hypothetical protein [Acinetobacter lanii]NHC04076.1 hypothetical protein [Acinetobacter lanii]QIO08854.1 hypothetical protein G8D99_07345 [Acinetobacter lanii]
MKYILRYFADGDFKKERVDIEVISTGGKVDFNKVQRFLLASNKVGVAIILSPGNL